MHYYLFNFLKTKCFEILVIFNALDSNKECQLNKHTSKKLKEIKCSTRVKIKGEFSSD